MSKIALVSILFSTVVGACAYAADPAHPAPAPAKAAEKAAPAPDKVDRADILSLENVDLRLRLAQQEAASARAAFQQKYQMGPNDAIDPNTLEIKRGKAAAPAPAKK